MRWIVDDEVRRLDGGRVALGGSPLRFLRLSAAGARAFDDLVAGRPGVPPAFTDRLVDRGLIHPVLDPIDAIAADDLTVVIPVRDRPAALDRALTALTAPTALTLEESDAHGLRNLHGPSVIVVDDGSLDGAAHAAVAHRHGATVIRLDGSRGPAAARNAGLAEITTPYVAFVDSDVEVSASSLCLLAGHLRDPAVALAAPRIEHHGGDRAIDRYEAVASSLDCGDRPAAIRPRSRVAYVPAAAMALRTAALRTLGGFDESLHVGEDVDLCWRLDAAGHLCRYDPSVAAVHAGRSSVTSWLWRIADYGTSAALLDERHPGQVPPVAASAWSVGVWILLGAGHPIVAAAGALGSGELLARRLRFLDHPRREAFRLVAVGHVGAGRVLGQSLVRPYWPLTLAASVVSRRARRVAAVAIVVPVLIEYRQRRPRLDPVRWTALRLADHIAYSTGVWRGALSQRRFGALRPDLTSWPGRARAGAGGASPLSVGAPVTRRSLTSTPAGA